MDQQEPFEPHLILPVGTQIVTRSAIKGGDGDILHQRGSVGVIVEALTDEVQQYRVRFPSGGEVVISRQHFVVRKHLRTTALQRLQEVDHSDLYPYVIYRCVVGSRA